MGGGKGGKGWGGRGDDEPHLRENRTIGRRLVGTSKEGEGGTKVWQIAKIMTLLEETKEA